MSAVLYVIGFAPLLIAFALTAVMRRLSVARGLMDVPNERSSHAAPTPRGGGVAIVVASLLAFGCLYALRAVDLAVFAALAGGGLAVAAVGLVDDRHPLPARIRLVVHFAAAFWALGWLRVPLLVVFPGLPLVSVATSTIVSALGIVWLLNLYNFMDGIDGIAASQAIFVSWGGALLLLVGGADIGVCMLAVAFGAACCGFLLWNWPPAKIFMGDVGSGYIGYVIAVLALLAARERGGSFSVWLMLSGVFIVDATVTLFRRLVRGERVYAAHRSHAYQWLARRWGKHRTVTLAVLAVNLLWLLPWALFATLYRDQASRAVVIALAPLVLLALLAGSGRSEQSLCVKKW